MARTDTERLDFLARLLGLNGTCNMKRYPQDGREFVTVGAAGVHFDSDDFEGHDTVAEALRAILDEMADDPMVVRTLEAPR